MQRLTPRGPARRRIRGLCLVVLVALLIGGCHSENRTSFELVEDIPSVPSDVTGSWFQERLPLGWFDQANLDNHRTVDARLSESIRDCMNGKGFEYVARSAQPYSVPFRRYGLLPGEDWTYTNNFGRPRSDQTTPAEPDDPAYNAALFGEADQSEVYQLHDSTGKPLGTLTTFGGCLAVGQVEVFGSIDKYAEFASLDSSVQLAVSDALEQLQSDPAVQTATHRWADCMKKRGFAMFQAPSSPLSDYDWSANPSHLDAEVVRQVDLECKAETDYLAQVFAVDYSIETDVLNRMGESLDRWRANDGIAAIQRAP